MTLKEFITEVSEGVERMFNTDSVVYPFMHFIDGQDQNVVMPIMQLGSKDQAMLIVRTILEATEAKRCVLVNESWVVNNDGLTAKESEAIDQYINDGNSLEFHPRRKEIMMLSGEDEKEGLHMATREIVREEGSKPRLGPLEFMPSYRSMEGRMLGLLPRKQRMSS